MASELYQIRDFIYTRWRQAIRSKDAGAQDALNDVREEVERLIAAALAD